MGVWVFIDILFVMLFGWYAAADILIGSYVGAVIWTGLTLYLSFCFVRDWEEWDKIEMEDVNGDE